MAGQATPFCWAFLPLQNNEDLRDLEAVPHAFPLRVTSRLNSEWLASPSCGSGMILPSVAKSIKLPWLCWNIPEMSSEKYVWGKVGTEE